MARRSTSEAARSASFSAPERSFADFLAASFALLRREVPAAYARMCCVLAPRQIALRVDDAAITVGFSSDGTHTLAAGSCTADVEVETSRATVLSVIDGETTLAQAVLDESLVMRGRLEDLVALHDGLVTYVHGGVRAPSFPTLLRAYRHRPGSSPGDSNSREGVNHAR